MDSTVHNNNGMNQEEITLGRINKVYSYVDPVDNIKKIVKCNSNLSNMQAEILSLETLQSNGFSIPHIYSVDFEKGEIVMEYVEHDIEFDSMLVESELKKLHSITNNKFGNTYPTYSGLDQMSNDWYDSWSTFFNCNRWKPLFESIRQNSIEFESNYCLSMKISDIMDKIFEGQDIKPSLLHGDLNPNNILTKDSKITFIDPACFYGDYRYDIACLDIWTDKKYQGDSVFMLYYSFILITVYKLTKNESRLKKARAHMNTLLSRHPPLYPSVITKLAKSDYPYVLIMCGSFNPVHLNHIKCMKIAKQHCMLKHNCESDDVLLVFCLAEDDRILSKCSNGVLLYHRKQMLQIALTNIPDICIDSSCMFGDNLISHYKNLISTVKCVYIVCGADNISHHYKHFRTDQLFLVTKRNKYKANFKGERVEYLDNAGEKTMSSTVIRSTEFANLNPSEFLDMNVYEYYKKVEI